MTQPPPPEPVIELGEFRYDTEPPPATDPDPEWRGQSWHQTVWTHRRRWSAVLVGALALLLGGSGLGQAPPLERVAGLPADAPASQMVATDEVLYLLITPGSGDPDRLEAYRWRDSTQLWSTPLAEPQFNAQLILAGEVPVLTSVGPDSEEVTAYDPATGRPRWSHPGYVLGAVTGGVLLGDVRGSRDPDPSGLDGRWSWVRAVDQVSGELVWQREMDLGNIAYDRRVEHIQVLIELGPDGQLTRYDPATGAVVGSVQTTVGQGGAQDNAGPGEQRMIAGIDPSEGGVTYYRDVPTMYLSPHYVVVTEPTELVAYELDGFEVRWRMDRSLYAWMTPCGDLVCALGSFATVDDSEALAADPDRVGDPDGSAGEDDLISGITPTASLVGLDPMTGEVRWSRGCADDVDPAFESPSDAELGEAIESALHCAFMPPDSLVDGVVMVGRTMITPDRDSYATLVLDSDTGELLDELELWSPVGRLREDVLFSYPSGGLTSIGPQGETAEPDTRWFGRWRTDDSRFQLLGQMDVEWCNPIAADYLSCAGPSGDDTGIWRIR